MNHLKEKMYLGKRVYGTAVVSPSTMWLNVIKRANLDFVFLDTEHIPLGRETLSNMCNMYSAIGVTPVVRIPSPDPYSATTVLDGGASAVLAPYVETVEQVKELVGAVKFRPLKGQKLKKVLNDPNTIDSKLQNYIDDRCKNYLLFINIESMPAVENLSELLAIQGIDGVIIGPHDLSCSMGLPEEYNHPNFIKVVEGIIQQCNKRNIGIGIHLSEEAEQQITWAKKGVNIILHSSDISLFGKALTRDIQKIQNSLNDGASDKDSKSIII